MAFDFGSPDDSSDNDGAADISAWQTGASKKRSTPPRRTSGFQAVNRPADDDIAMQSTPEPEPEPAPTQLVAPVARMQKPTAEPTVISSGEDSSSDDEEEEDAPPMALPEQNEDMEDDVWAAVDEVIEDFSVLPEDEDEPTPVEDNAPEDHEPSTHTHDQSAEVVISRDELDDEERVEFVDLTARASRVRRVSNERTDDDGMMQYTVTFEDYHIEEVCLTCEIFNLHVIIRVLPITCDLHLEPATSSNTQQLTVKPGILHRPLTIPERPRGTQQVRSQRYP
jgi:hypothetical protein